MGTGLNIHTTHVAMHEKPSFLEAEWSRAITELCSLNHIEEADVLCMEIMFCVYVSTMESKKSPNGCLRQVESQFQRFVSTVSCSIMSFC
ncbi:hypothetical protein Bca4012_011799 [Brassica carinata]